MQSTSENESDALRLKTDARAVTTHVIVINQENSFTFFPEKSITEPLGKMCLMLHRIDQYVSNSGTQKEMGSSLILFRYKGFILNRGERTLFVGKPGKDS